MPYYDDILEFEPNLDGSDLRVGIVMSRFNIDIGEGLLSACTAELKKNGMQDSNILIVTVPGALEIPLTIKRMAMSDQFDALIALGAVIRGDTYHFEIVANESARGLLMVQLEAEIPIANGILTTDNEDQAISRMSAKGMEAAQVALEVANLHIKIDEVDI
ncbi:6,7-dimethyl-8-ribityllumazine synthase [Nitrosomonas ureae]|uniref:6,7-dimethyl-8-ribityllumazine synthase n=1 Tax=Nitrosomonas ureae TaxID=44577 RepID=A0A0S3AGR6_9PROT|nr:6,7-dimethyl-8-ribityllumazine synthase [Nitrosomonas ureae]ALQ50381.1 6,7-dimethyl-8-ribityllumazine synthase [Nitrosomonas ureae]PTQ87464.1 6,7-dimethyl-8-ribityllumazine synthase [Nitrosomonas ureae]PXX17152.1 6,7-dimethyl-8-ribityllumazine synthase [Nitrosomonas ureae]SDT87620.1 6,7-dimethyl-8-ribityllumazine synthase [Nitrosomonas ureae]SEP64577.1 6,7-dimethyl-8-ribityllumazine synthase [Nitrosomonas ureae]